MNHEEAINQYAAEQYLLGELGQSEAEAFEAHMFECPACAEQVKLGMELLREARRYLKNEGQGRDSEDARSSKRPCRTFPSRRRRQ